MSITQKLGRAYKRETPSCAVGYRATHTCDKQMDGGASEANFQLDISAKDVQNSQFAKEK